MKYSLLHEEVETLLKKRVRFRTRFFLFKTQKNKCGICRVAFVFSRKRGNAVLRNRFKRRIRELIRRQDFKDTGLDFLCIPSGSLQKITQESWRIEREQIGKNIKCLFESSSL
jgi:ribonuclease P protein component